eukprot:743286-Pleurochrysis_carterae.AAC.3
MSRLRSFVTGGTTCRRRQYGALLRPWCYESLRGSAVRVSRIRIRDKMIKQRANILVYTWKEPKSLSSFRKRHDVNYECLRTLRDNC